MNLCHLRLHLGDEKARPSRPCPVPDYSPHFLGGHWDLGGLWDQERPVQKQKFRRVQITVAAPISLQTRLHSGPQNLLGLRVAPDFPPW